MTTLPQELAFLRAGVADLEQYLISNELFWPLMGDMQRLSPGSLLLSFKRVQALLPTQADRSVLEPLTTTFDFIRTSWRAAWEDKVHREISNRLQLWQDYIAEYRADPGHNAGIYINEVRNRAMLALLAGELSAPPTEMDILKISDAVIRAQVVTGECIWGAELGKAFPRDSYWFLYRSLSASSVSSSLSNHQR